MFQSLSTAGDVLILFKNYNHNCCSEVLLLQCSALLGNIVKHQDGKAPQGVSHLKLRHGHGSCGILFGVTEPPFEICVSSSKTINGVIILGAPHS